MPQRPINELSSASSYSSDPTISRILYRDPNWGLTVGYANQDIYWRSRESAAGEGATGRFDIGYFTLKNKLVFPVAGGGGTNGHLKSLKIIKALDNSTLAIYTLDTLLAGANSDTLKIAVIDTSSLVNIVCSLSFVDSDPNGGWAWIGFDLSNVYCY